MLTSVRDDFLSIKDNSDGEVITISSRMSEWKK